MRRITLWLVSTVTVVVLLFSYRTSLSGASASTATRDTGAANAPGVVSGGGATPAPAASSGSAGSSGSSGSNSASKTTVVNGSVAQTRWGPVQVQVTIASGKITDVVALQVPNGNRRDDEINSFAVPMLHDEVLQAQSASINTVSGATVTSDGYIQSLQAALDAAHFKG
ncbi:MAG TPA: FMN-binding protein [Rugosimonospora sp.]|nr:FMN-binding protein [Rugosimonospora sp.]